MELQYLTEFVTLAQNGNYLDTAEELFISQSTLSKHIMLVEKELNVSLFDRTTRHVRLSEDGKLFLPYAVKITELQKEYSNILKSKKAATSNRLIFASTSQVTQYEIVDTLAAFKRAHINCKLDLQVQPHDALKGLLMDQKVDFIWVGEPDGAPEEEECVRICYHKDPLVVVCPITHEFSSRKTIAVSELRQQEIIIQDNTSIEQRLFRNFCIQNGFVPNLLSVPGGQTIIDFVKKGLGIAIMMETVARNFETGNLRLIPLSDSPVINVNLLYLKNTRLSQVSREFIRFVQEEKS